jgi:hypothetical protein
MRHFMTDDEIQGGSITGGFCLNGHVFNNYKIRFRTHFYRKGILRMFLCNEDVWA